MTSRRSFIANAAAVGVSASVSLNSTQVKTDAASAKPNLRAPNAVRPSGMHIRAAIRRDETILRLGGHGDIYNMTWAADDRQYVAVCDGAGWFAKPKRFYNSRLFSISGSPSDARFQDVSGYPELAPDLYGPNPRYYNFGTVALDGFIYQYLSTFNRPFSATAAKPPLRFNGAKLIYSPDNGRTWRNQDGTTPVSWEPWGRRSRQTMVFFEESQEAFSILSILQMGRNYSGNTDGYVYVYAPNGNTEGTMNQLVMFRVAKAHILNRAAYEYFAGVRPDGSATWIKDISARGIVHTFPRGWVNTKTHPWAWHPSVTYNIPLGIYMMATWGMGSSADGTWFGKPSYLGFWSAPNPWGPWTQIHEETAWTTASDLATRPYAPQISPKWIAEDGKSFWLVWTDFKLVGESNTYPDQQRDEMSFISRTRRLLPYYAFNTQRVDLVVT